MGERLRTLENNRALLISHQRAIQPFRETLTIFVILMPAVGNRRTLEHNHRLEDGAVCDSRGVSSVWMASAGQTSAQ